ncbi:hypothetical protein RB595_003556 [Gaeumannomyces hyphopodioides]
MEARARSQHSQQSSSYPYHLERERTSHSESSVAAASFHTASSGGHNGLAPCGEGGTSSDLSHDAASIAHHTRRSYNSSGSSIQVAPEYWPKVDSDESDEAPAGSSSLGQQPPQKKPTSSTKRFFRYVAKKFGKAYEPRYGYIPTDEKEDGRNEIQHKIFYELFEDKLHLAPAFQPGRVLDVGTGPGCWAIDYAKLNPQATVVGVDIEPVRPRTAIPRNCQFMLMDVTKDWTETFPEGDEQGNGFDLIHVRMMGDMVNSDSLMRSAYAHLNPGGWAEFTEWVVVIETPDRSCEGGAFMRWSRLLRQGLQRMGSSVYYPFQYKDQLLGAGFTNVAEVKNAAPTNACYPGKRMQRIGNRMVRNWLLVLEPVSVPVFHSLGWSQTALDLLLDEVKKEIVDTKKHSYMTLLTVYCQKPLVGGSLASSKIESIHS